MPRILLLLGFATLVLPFAACDSDKDIEAEIKG